MCEFYNLSTQEDTIVPQVRRESGTFVGMQHSVQTPGSMRFPGEGVMRQEGCKPISGETHLKVSSSLPKMMVEANEEMCGQ